MAKLTFWGASQQVTGSMFMLEADNGFTILVDCGIDVERKRAAMEGPVPPLFEFDPSSINAVLLTHAHIDHSGSLPNLVKRGFTGEIFCTTSTYDLTQFLLLDSAALNRKKAAAWGAGGKNDRRKRGPQGQKPSDLADLYTDVDVDLALDNFRTVQFNRPFLLAEGVEITFNRAGHLLGAANILVKLTENGETKTICFSGDVGRPNYPLLEDPIPAQQVDYMIMESTYGGRQHTETRGYEEVVRDVIERTCILQPGRLLVPAFAVGRSQTILHIINKIYKKANLPPIKVFVDSPLAVQSTRVYERHLLELNQDAQEFAEQYGALFDFDSLTFVSDMKGSKAINNYKEPCVIISSAGMMEGGRIQAHVQNNVGNPLCTIFMIGYMAEGTLGHRLMTGEADSLTFNKKEVAVRARIERTDIFSGHAGHSDLIRFAKSQDPRLNKGTFLVHGELESMEALQSSLANEGFDKVHIPAKGQSYLI